MRHRMSLSSMAFRVVCLGFSATLLVMTLFTQICLVRTRGRITELEKEISRAENERVLLQIQTSSEMGIEVLEHRAVQELGMRHPEPGQIMDIPYLG